MPGMIVSILFLLNATWIKEQRKIICVILATILEIVYKKENIFLAPFHVF
jgi:hypothetical protein